MAILMVLRMREYGSSGSADRFMARRVADELKITDVEAADAVRDVTTGREYSFLVNAFKPRYYFWCASKQQLSHASQPKLCRHDASRQGVQLNDLLLCLQTGRVLTWSEN